MGGMAADDEWWSGVSQRSDDVRVEGVFVPDHRTLLAEDLLPGVRIAGAATFVEEALSPDTQALVY